MKKSGITALVSVALLVILMIPLGWAYYEYIGQYGVLLNGDGTINQNAFGVLNGEDYRTEELGYGTTPENPFVVDNIDRLYNLIKLNNSGRLESSKTEDTPQYYFVLDFTEEELPQVLDLEGITIESVGNNAHPFVDKLSGLLYAYSYTIDEQKKYILLSGLIDTVEVTVEGSTVYIDGTQTNLSSGSAAPGEYIKIPGMYIEDVDGGGFTTDENSMYVPVSSLTEVRNVIANATVEVPDEQIDVGFFSTIGARTITVDDEEVEFRGGVHDFILHNITVKCVETAPKSVWAAIGEVWAGLFGSHNNEEEYTGDDTGYYERHIGLFAGHIDGNVSNITVSGEGKIEIDSEDVNYYSVFTTAGYIDGNAMIGESLFSALTESGIGATDGVGIMFADEIYAAAGNTDSALGGIEASDGWGGTSTANGDILFFKYGSFRFVLSDNNDMVGEIWSNSNATYLLGAEGYEKASSVLYCNDEYRFSSTTQAGGSLVSSPASANETKYQGVHSLVASGSSLDKGSYVIAAKVPDGNGGYYYYALKIVAEIGTDGSSIVYSFDTSTKHDITDYINGTANDIYSSAVWYTDADSSTPKFRNSRFTVNYLSVSENDGVYEKALAATKEDAAEFSYSVQEKTFYYKTDVNTDDGIVSVYHYLNYDTSNGFTFGDSKGVDIEVYRLSNGFSFELVDSVADLTENDDYVIVAKSGTKSYLLGEAIDEESGTVIAQGTFANDLPLDEIPDKWSLEEYQDNRQYIWYSSSASSGVVTFYDKLSGTYYLATADGGLVMSTIPKSWTYTQSSGQGGTLASGSSYLSYSAPGSSTGFGLSTSGYTIYLYKLNADEDNMSFNTYQGAKLVTSESSSVEAGMYLIAADNGNGSYTGLVMNGSGSFGTADLTYYITGSGTGSMSDLTATSGTYAGYKWEVGETSSEPSFKNMGYSSYLSRVGNSAVAASSDEVEWMYDASSGRFYYIIKTTVGETVSATTYYLAYGSGGFVITEGQESGYNYDILLFKVTYNYIYENVKPVQSLTHSDSITQNNKIYFIMSEPLSDIESKAVYVLGSKGTSDGSAVESVNISQESEYDDSSEELTTSIDLSYYRWRFSPRYSSGTTIYTTGYQFINDVTGLYLAASTSSSSRTLVVATESNINKRPTSTAAYLEDDDIPPTGIGLGGTSNASGGFQKKPFYNENTDGSFAGSCFYVMGRRAPWEYYVWKTSVPGVFALSLQNSSTTKPSDYSMTYMYESTGYTIDVSVNAVSERGDNLDAGYHYMIAAKTTDSKGNTQYYALSEIMDENGDKSLSGINVTSQATTINDSNITDDYGNIIEESSTDSLRMVPQFADWYQVSSEKGLRFYHSLYSTNAEHEYLSVVGGVPSYERISVSSTDRPADWYYDSISKYFKYYDENGTCYYLRYDASYDSFSLTTDEGEATNFYIYRFKPTYVVKQIISADDEAFKSSNFVVAYYTPGSYKAIGVDKNSVLTGDITSYLTADGSFRDDLSETEYYEIINYIWKQQYYDFSGDTYSASTPYLQLFSYVTGGGFTVAYEPPYIQTGSDPMSWSLTSQSGGLWRLLNSKQNGSVSADSKYLRYTSSQFQTGSSTSGASLYIFRIDQSAEIDEVTDINSMLGSRMALTPTISLLESSKYMIVAEVDTDNDDVVDKYYSFGMIDAVNTQALDITDIMKHALTGNTATVFDATVWEQRGNDIRLIFDNIAFSGSGDDENPWYYLLTGAEGSRNSMEPVVVKEDSWPADPSAYEWRAYSDNDGYLFGYTDKDSGEIYYLYFDANSLVFKLTSSKTVARIGGGMVQLYELGAETVNQPNFLTPIITTEDDIITSYPINEVESVDDLKQYNDGYTDGGNNGQYLIIAQSGNSHYALVFSETGTTVRFVDVSPYFSGNYSYDDNENLCIAVNQRYIWLQTNEVNSVLPYLSFKNMGRDTVLGTGNYDFFYDLENGQLSFTESDETKYIAFDPTTGYTYGSTEPSDISLKLFYLGESGIDTGDGGTLNYTYYSVPLGNTPGSGIDFSRFEFLKKHTEELVSFAVGDSGQVEKSVGWSLAEGNMLTEINTSVFFAQGIDYDASAENPIGDFAGSFAEMESAYSYIDPATGDTVNGAYNYYAPKGSVAFAVSEASSENPLFINVVVSTEFDSTNFDENILRYLALWRVGAVDNKNGTVTALRTYTGSDVSSAADFAFTLAGRLDTPDFAIPLPHRYATTTNGASYAYVDGSGYEISDSSYDECLIAHTFVITEPGLYYLGSNYGSVAISYISVENLTEGETSGISAGSQLTIDFCWGDIVDGGTSGITFDPEAPGESLGNLSYVGGDEWVHSNIFPEFRSGTGSNPADKLTLKVIRALEDSDNGISRVTVTTNTEMRIAGGVKYSNGNNSAQRQKRKVTFNVYCGGLAAEEYSYGSTDQYVWLASWAEDGTGFRLYSLEVAGGKQQAFYLNADGTSPRLSTIGNLLWTSDSGYIKTVDGGYYLNILEDGTAELSAQKGGNSVMLYIGGTVTAHYGDPTEGGSYMLLSDNSYMIRIIQPD